LFTKNIKSRDEVINIIAYKCVSLISKEIEFFDFGITEEELKLYDAMWRDVIAQINKLIGKA
jgi:hypothetical protein